MFPYQYAKEYPPVPAGEDGWKLKTDYRDEVQRWGIDISEASPYRLVEQYENEAFGGTRNGGFPLCKSYPKAWIVPRCFND